MAIDTAEKRASVFGHGRPWHRLVQPDATKPEAWRASVASVYSGNAVAAPPAPGALTTASLGWVAAQRTKAWTAGNNTRVWTAATGRQELQ